MTTAILVAVTIIIAIGIFYIGMFVGGYAMSKKLADGVFRAIDNSFLPTDAKLDLIEKIQKEVKQ